MFYLLKANNVKTKEVSDYKQMSSEAIENLLTDYQNELAGIEARQEWLSGEIEELQGVLDDRVQDSVDNE